MERFGLWFFISSKAISLHFKLKNNILNYDKSRHNYIPCTDQEIDCQTASIFCQRKSSENLYLQPKKKQKKYFD